MNHEQELHLKSYKEICSTLPAGCSVCKHPQRFCWRLWEADEQRWCQAWKPVRTHACKTFHRLTDNQQPLTQKHTYTRTHVDRMHEIFRHERKLCCVSEFLVFLWTSTAHSWCAAKCFLYSHLVRAAPTLEKLKYNEILSHICTYIWKSGALGQTLTATPPPEA